MNQTKKILAYLGCIAFTALGVWLLTVEDPTTSYPLWTIRVAGILSIIFFGGGGLFMAYKKVKLLINHKKDIEFTDRGISICGAEEILWNEIIDFSLIRFKGNRLITIQMKDPEKVIANESSWIKRKTMEYNLKTINALYSFPAYMMDGRAEEALTLCKLNLAKHQKAITINNPQQLVISSIIWMKIYYYTSALLSAHSSLSIRYSIARKEQVSYQLLYY